MWKGRSYTMKFAFMADAQLEIIETEHLFTTKHSKNEINTFTDILDNDIFIIIQKAMNTLNIMV